MYGGGNLHSTTFVLSLFFIYFILHIFFFLCFLPPELNPEQVRCLDPSSVRNINFHDFVESLKRIRRSVSPSSLTTYEKWNLDYGDVSLWEKNKQFRFFQMTKCANYIYKYLIIFVHIFKDLNILCLIYQQFHIKMKKNWYLILFIYNTNNKPI